MKDFDAWMAEAGKPRCTVDRFAQPEHGQQWAELVVSQTLRANTETIVRAHVVDALKRLGEMHGLALPPQAEAEMRAFCDAPVEAVRRGEVGTIDDRMTATGVEEAKALGISRLLDGWHADGHSAQLAAGGPCSLLDRGKVIEWPAGEQFMPANWPAGFTWSAHSAGGVESLHFGAEAKRWPEIGEFVTIDTGMPGVPSQTILIP